MSTLENRPALLCAFELRAGAARRIKWEDVDSGLSPDDGYLWIALNRHSPDTRSWLNGSGLPKLAVSALLAEETRPRLLHVGGGMVINLRGVNLNPGAAPEDMVSVRLWLDRNRAISVQLRPLRAVLDTERQLEKGILSPQSVGAFVASLVSSLIDRMEPVIREYAEKIDHLEEESIETAGAELRLRLGRIRRDAIILRRYIAPQRDLLLSLSADQNAPFDDRDRLDLRENADRVTRFVEELDAVRDRASVVNDQLVDKRAEEMNRNMLLLSVVAAIFLPLSFITGLLGVNVAGIPGASSPYAFATLVGLMLILALGLVTYFRRKKWL